MKIRRPFSSLERTAKNRPDGYLEDLMKIGTIDGETIVFEESEYLEAVAKYSPEKLALKKHIIATHNRLGLDARGFSEEKKEQLKTICQNCEHFLPEISKCGHPNCGCPRSSSRVEPWENLATCAAGRWV